MSYEIIRQSQPKARKVYRCTWCGEDILKGEKHHYNVGNYEGDFQESRYHDDCNTAAVKYFIDDPGGCFDPMSFERGTLRERGTIYTD